MFTILVPVITSLATMVVQIGFADPRRKINRAFNEVEVSILQNNLDMANAKNQTEKRQNVTLPDQRKKISELLKEKEALKNALKEKKRK